MNPLCRVGVAVLSSMLVFSPLSSPQEQHQHGAPEKLGEVLFPISCAPAVQSSFNHSVALLHSFAYSAAEKSFLEVARADPKCAMAHWGVAISYYHQLWEPPISPAELQRGQLEIQKAKTLGGGSPREQGFIDALALFYKDAPGVPHATRALAYQQAMSTVALHNPDDRESQIFYALALLGTASPTDRSRANQKHAAEILEPLFKRYPQHPGVAHYLIHAYDNPELASRGLPTARAYAQIAPSAPHALHMPSHIFTLLGLWPDSILSNSAARAAAQRQGDVGEALHAMDYLMYAYLQAGRNSEAARFYRNWGPCRNFRSTSSRMAMPLQRCRFVMPSSAAHGLKQRRFRRSWEVRRKSWPSPIGATQSAWRQRQTRCRNARTRKTERVSSRGSRKKRRLLGHSSGSTNR